MGRVTISQIGARAVIALATAIMTLGIAAGCGEKDEPDPNSVGPSTDQASGFEIKGTWQGRLEQKQTKPFRVTATIGSLDDPRLNTVSYTGIDCRGHWTYLGRSGLAYRFREVIDRGKSKACKGSGAVTLSPTPDGRLEYRFRGGGVTSEGVLTRTG